jgi:hypothetical protein
MNLTAFWDVTPIDGIPEEAAATVKKRNLSLPLRYAKILLPKERRK